jgi:hypothetical protein
LSKKDIIMYLPDFKRNKFGLLSKRLQEKLPFIQVLLGPRQVGKTTAVHQILDTWEGEGIYGTADAGNTSTLAHYQQLLDSAYLVTGLQKWHGTSIPWNWLKRKTKLCITCIGQIWIGLFQRRGLCQGPADVLCTRF